MRKTLTIGSKEVDLLSNAATAILYKQTFHEDLLKVVTGLSAAAEDVLVAVEAVQRLTFIMNMQATEPFSNLVGKLAEEKFVYWLMQFEESDFQTPEVLAGVLAVWNKNFQSASEAKNL